jgi:predicted hotdog family 3-hydroxylacyl-ACP dehydratase
VDAVRLTGDAVAALVPQRGSMSLLDAVERFDATRIVCTSARHRDPANPLREDGRLSALAAIEFAAQAMAAHGALVAAGAPLTGWLARVRDCVVCCGRMDDLPSPLTIEAERIAGGERALSYRFAVTAERVEVARGTILIALAAEAST